MSRCHSATSLGSTVSGPNFRGISDSWYRKRKRFVAIFNSVWQLWEKKDCQAILQIHWLRAKWVNLEHACPPMQWGQVQMLSSLSPHLSVGHLYTSIQKWEAMRMSWGHQRCIFPLNCLGMWMAWHHFPDILSARYQCKMRFMTDTDTDLDT